MVAEQSPTRIPKRAKGRAYVAFCGAVDRDLLARLIEQSRQVDAPFEVVGSSLDVDAGPDWESRVAAAVAKADLVIVILGTIIHTLAGFQYEAEIARDLGKPVIALYEYPEDFGSVAFKFATQVVWTADSLRQAVNELLQSEEYPRAD